MQNTTCPLWLQDSTWEGVRTTRHIYKLAPNMQTCPILKSPQFKLAPNTNSPHFIVYGKIQFVLVVFDHRSNVYPTLQVMVLVNKRRDRSMLCVLSHVNTPSSYIIDLLLLNPFYNLTYLPHTLYQTHQRDCLHKLK